MGFFRYGELPLVILALLQRRPMNGYEILGELGRHFSPGYAPSPGSIYPAISALRRSGLIEAEDDNGKPSWRQATTRHRRLVGLATNSSVHRGAGEAVTGVLRVAAAVSGGDVTLPEPARLRSFTRKERRALTAALSQVVAGQCLAAGAPERAARMRRIRLSC